MALPRHDIRPRLQTGRAALPVPSFLKIVPVCKRPSHSKFVQMKMRVLGNKAVAVVGAVVLAVGGALAVPTTPTAHDSERAAATLRLADGQRVGHVMFYGDPWTITRVTVTVNMPRRAPLPGFHGLHVHANNDPANGSGCKAEAGRPASTWFVSADGHFSEPDVRHGDHAGDLPPLLVTTQGRAYSSSITDRFDVQDLVGRAVVLHAGPDNLGNIPTGSSPTQYTPNSRQATDLTSRTGNAGDRAACGVITRR